MTYDERLATAATDTGLPTVAPEQGSEPCLTWIVTTSNTFSAIGTVTARENGTGISCLVRSFPKSG